MATRLIVTTRTLTAIINQKIDIERLLYALPITRIKLPPGYKIKSKQPKPNPGGSGKIINAELYDLDIVRGIPREKNPSKNCICGYINFNDKVIHCKIYEYKIITCGKLEQEEIASFLKVLLDKISDCQKVIDYARANPEITKITLDWILKNMKGSPTFVLKDSYYLYEDDNPSHQNQDKDKVNLIVIPNRTPDYLDDDIFNMCLSLAYDCYHFAQFFSLVEYLFLTDDNIYNEELKFQEIKNIMVPHTYNLGFGINRQELHRRLQGVKGVYCQYINSIHNFVRIDIKFKIPDNFRETIMRRDIDNITHKFLVYRTGTVSQSGACEELNEVAYSHFMKLIAVLKPHIERN